MDSVPSKPEELRDRTKRFALRIVRRSGTSVGANYRAVCRARSRAEFIARIGIVAEEADESVFWMELLGESNAVPEARLTDLLNEARELTAIFTKSQTTAKESRR